MSIVHGRRELPNRLLSQLNGKEFAPLISRLEDVALGMKQALHEPGDTIRYVYFPGGAVVSLVVVMGDGAIVETAVVGYEGMVGTPILFGATSAHHRAFCQIAGPAKRLPAGILLRQMERSRKLRRLLNRYAQGLMNQFAQGVACNRLHSVEQRCARWLLATHDRVGADSFRLTQEFLAAMLGVRRASVTEVAGRLQQAGLIRYNHGNMTLLDRKGLESAACECYGAIAGEFERLIGVGARTGN